MKRLSFIILVILLSVGLIITGCSPAPVSSSGEKVYKVGLLQLVEHPSLDYVREGMLEAIKANGFEQGKNIIIDYQNAQIGRAHV